jgi:flagellar P-ring protein precursor FlgI
MFSSKSLSTLVAAALSVCLSVLVPISALAQPALLKDIAHVQGVVANQLVGYGVVTGLAGTGDSTSVTFTSKTIQNILQNFGLTTNLSDVQTRNVAAVMVTAELPPFAHSGDRVDVTVSSMGDSTTLQGGTLIMSELHGPDNQVYATAQGPISVGGFTIGDTGNSVTKNHTAAGRIPQGGVVAKTMTTNIQSDASGFSYVLTAPDAQTASRVAKALNRRFGQNTARANDYETVHVTLPGTYLNDPIDFLADAGDLTIAVGQTARVVMNERTGTVVMGGDITLAPCAIAHGNLSVTITTNNTVVAPGAFTNAQSQTQTNTSVKATEEKKKLVMLQGSPTLAQVVRALNTIGVSPRDLIAIVQALREAGSLQADLETI